MLKIRLNVDLSPQTIDRHGASAQTALESDDVSGKPILGGKHFRLSASP